MAGDLHGSSPVVASGAREDINRIAAAHGARNVRVFGSVGDLTVEGGRGRVDDTITRTKYAILFVEIRDSNTLGVGGGHATVLVRTPS